MIGHLGSRVSALLDGQLPPAEAERAWEHVHACHACRDLVEREGWVKTRLAGLAGGAAPSHLKGALLGAADTHTPAPAEQGSLLRPPPFPTHGSGGRRPGVAGALALGSGALGAAVMGAVVLTSLPAEAPDRRPPTTSLVRQTEPPVLRIGGVTPLPSAEPRPGDRR
ncbi:zf-HC2 domain-containing protein [Nocardioides sp. GCM10027113]|uniref:zf-HC2 domain-containing protein n=1 Tax=unclassified Nocardioides TaxID=2615069 RepID=UPI003614B6D2